MTGFCSFYGQTVTDQDGKGATIKCAKMPGGGRHYYFTEPEGKEQIALCSSGGKDCPYRKEKDMEEQGKNDLDEMQLTMLDEQEPPAPTAPGQLTEKQQEAVTLHRKILTDGQIAADSLVALAEDLKRMRDTKLYLELGYASFEDYCEKAAGIRQRQAYNFIRALEEFGKSDLQANASLGITKLAALATLAEDDRARLMEQEDVAALSTRELQAKVDELQHKCDQLSLLSEELQAEKERQEESSAAQRKSLQARLDDTGDAMRAAAAEAAELRRRLKELESRPVEVAVAEPSEEQLEKIRKAALAEAEAAFKEGAAAAEKAQKAAEEKAAALEKKVADLQATAKKAPPPQGDSKALIKHYFSEIQRQMNEALQLIAAEPDKDKYKEAFAKLLAACTDMVRGV